MLRGFNALAKSVPEGAKFRNTPSACGGERDFEDFASLFDEPSPANIPPNPKTPTTVETGSQLATIKARVGQAEFSDKIKSLNGNTCCFPEFNVTDRRFLVGAHIARWSDNEELRGNLGNGLCLCVTHDKAFEIGIFTIDENCQVYVTPEKEIVNHQSFKRYLNIVERKSV